MSTAHQTRKARLAIEQQFKRQELDAERQYVERLVPAPSPRRALSAGQTRFGKPGQCAYCGVFRADGQPPTVHRTDCGAGPDGSALPALNADRVPDKVPTKIPAPQRSRHPRR